MNKTIKSLIIDKEHENSAVENLKGAGKTEEMIECVIECLKEGQPICRVIGANKKTLDCDLIPRILKSLQNTDLQIKKINQYQYNCSESLLSFHIVSELEQDLKGCEEYDCQFWDHFAIAALESMKGNRRALWKEE